jgi:hypothetical protein
VADGLYAGHYPANGKEAVALLDLLREKGAEYIVFPEPSLWWLEYYGELAERLAGCGELCRDASCRIFCLRLPQGEGETGHDASRGPCRQITTPDSADVATLEGQ